MPQVTTYELGQQPDGAPVTWEYNDARGRAAAIRLPDQTTVIVPWQQADPIARAFHLAKLAEEAAYMLRKSTDKDVSEWLNRYREAVK